MMPVSLRRRWPEIVTLSTVAAVVVGLNVLLVRATIAERTAMPTVAATVPVAAIPTVPPPPPSAPVVPEPSPPPEILAPPAPSPLPKTSPPPPPVVVPPPIPVPAPQKLEPTFVVPGRYKVGDAITQEVTLARRSAFRVLGTEVGQAAEYAFASRLVIDAIGRDGSLTVKQKIEAARLINCDPAQRATFADALKAAQGTSFEYTVNTAGQVTQFRGPKDPIRVQTGNDATGAQTFRVWSLLDEDGWREMAGLTFLRPAGPLRTGLRWTRPLSHSWGPLGEWTGRTTYAVAGRQAGLDRVIYAHEMLYRPPATGAVGNLPLQLARAEFRVLTAGGVVLFDSNRDRVSAAEETFRVQGTLSAAVGGAEGAVEMEEMQTFRLRLQEAATQTLRGQPNMPR